MVTSSSSSFLQKFSLYLLLLLLLEVMLLVLVLLYCTDFAVPLTGVWEMLLSSMQPYRCFEAAGEARVERAPIVTSLLPLVTGAPDVIKRGISTFKQK